MVVVMGRPVLEAGPVSSPDSDLELGSSTAAAVCHRRTQPTHIPTQAFQAPRSVVSVVPLSRADVSSEGGVL